MNGVDASLMEDDVVIKAVIYVISIGSDHTLSMLRRVFARASQTCDAVNSCRARKWSPPRSIFHERAHVKGVSTPFPVRFARWESACYLALSECDGSQAHSKYAATCVFRLGWLCGVS